jgi:hypothetical protein
VNVSRIKNETGVSIRIPPDADKNNLIRIEGDPQGVAKAKKELLDMVQKMVSIVQMLLLVTNLLFLCW